MKPTSWWSVGEKILLYSVYTGLAGLLLAQCVLFFPFTGKHFSRVKNLEGSQFKLEDAPADNYGYFPAGQAALDYLLSVTTNKKIVLKLTKFKSTAETEHILALVNGRIAGNFHNGYISIDVADGDYLEIDATRASEAVQVAVEVADRTVKFPVDGQLLTGRGGIIPVGKVRLKGY